VSFDEDPADVPNYPCPECGDEVRKSPQGIWECEMCDWTPDAVLTQRIPDDQL